MIEIGRSIAPSKDPLSDTDSRPMIARDPESRIIEKLPLQLDATDLATYCHRVIGDFREDRAHLYPQVTLEFQYKEAA
jgi:hypothetical protein